MLALRARKKRHAWDKSPQSAQRTVVFVFSTFTSSESTKCSVASWLVECPYEDDAQIGGGCRAGARRRSVDRLLVQPVRESGRGHQRPVGPGRESASAPQR